MNRKELVESLKRFEKTGKSAEDLNTLRIAIFDAFDAEEIQARTKDSLLKDLYQTATMKGIFFLRVMDRKPGLPKNDDEEEERRKEEEQSYEESYEESLEESYDEEEEEDETK